MRGRGKDTVFQTRVERKVAGATSLPSLEGNQQIRSRSERKGNISTQLRNIDVNTRRQKALTWLPPGNGSTGPGGSAGFHYEPVRTIWHFV